MIVKIKLEDETSVDLEIDKEIGRKIKENISQIIDTELAEDIEKNIKNIIGGKSENLGETIKVNTNKIIDKKIIEKIEKKLKKIKNIDETGCEIVLDMSKVDDVYRYLISCDEKNKLSKVNSEEDNDGESSGFKYEDRSTSEDKIHETIVLLLESPHKNEYTDKREPIGPARGKTGKFIDKNIMMVLREIQNREDNLFEKNKNYRIIICNPIQYQTSLYMYHNMSLNSKYKELRNDCWNKLWEEEKIKINFKERISSYNAKFIINACTSEFKEKITKYLKQEDFNNIYTTSHPSSWNVFNLKK